MAKRYAVVFVARCRGNFLYVVRRTQGKLFDSHDIAIVNPLLDCKVTR